MMNRFQTLVFYFNSNLRRYITVRLREAARDRDARAQPLASPPAWCGGAG